MSQSLPERAPRHVVTFYEADDVLVARASSFIAEGLARNEHVIAMSTLGHWNAITARLHDRGVAYGHAAREGRLLLIEVDEVVDALMVDGRLDLDRFRAMLVPLMRPGTKVRVYGQLVSLLAERGDVEGALAAERLGHELTHIHDVEVMCGYQVNGARPLTAGDIQRIEAAHDSEHTHFHAVRFYQDRDSLARIVGQFLGEGFAMGLPAIVIARPEHREAIAAALAGRRAVVSKPPMLAS